MRILILPVVLAASALASIPVHDACSEDAPVVANIQESDAIQIRHGVLGESIPCYAVSVAHAGTEIQGFILGNTLPVVQEFERKRARESRIPIPEAPPPAPGEKKASAPRPTGPAFEPWSGVTTSGRRMQIAPGAAKVTLVVFWAAQSGVARNYAEKMMKTAAEFRPKGLQSFGIVEAPSLQRVNYYMDDMSLDYPQALDRQRLAAKYNADPLKGTTLVLDESNHIVAASSNPLEIRAAVLSLLAP